MLGFDPVINRDAGPAIRRIQRTKEMGKGIFHMFASLSQAQSKNIPCLYIISKSSAITSAAWLRFLSTARALRAPQNVAKRRRQCRGSRLIPFQPVDLLEEHGG